MDNPKVKLIFPFNKMNERKRANIYKANLLLSKAGVSFDSYFDKGREERVWDLGHIKGAEIKVK